MVREKEGKAKAGSGVLDILLKIQKNNNTGPSPKTLKPTNIIQREMSFKSPLQFLLIYFGNVNALDIFTLLHLHIITYNT